MAKRRKLRGVGLRGECVRRSPRGEDLVQFELQWRSSLRPAAEDALNAAVDRLAAVDPGGETRHEVAEMLVTFMEKAVETLAANYGRVADDLLHARKLAADRQAEIRAPASQAAARAPRGPGKSRA